MATDINTDGKLFASTTFLVHPCTMKLFYFAFCAIATIFSVCIAQTIPRGQLTEITNFGSNPTNVRNYVYVPSNLKSSPGLLAAIHYCSGTAQAFYSGTAYKSLADQYGFIVLYPNAPDPSGGGCWDVHSNATLTHDAGGDSLGIVNGMRYIVTQFNVNPAKVFATGLSSGAMMTNVLAGAYPDFIKAGSAFAGVPYACFAGSSMWNSQCSQGQSIKTGQQWGDLVRSGYPGYTGSRPKMQLWHGTADTTLYTQNFYEEVKQWTNVFNVSETATATTQNWPISGWTKSDYGPNVQAILANGVTHNIPIQATQVIEWLGLNV
ncbi:carbohydrate esterase family 1 protein [Cylindrobasidium torrendii FP15055 ss-10]|uniref:Carboxylic ester hydrolase n=1 Tax=Cylindrobasidium torrendii FP15055 ss-10 TaxID=1314674 RepID=A0A0D7BTR1_9AGAR|nr:carbohydrate esterase family 1 protein [Cylindrobasidium torrendii FP15055 ss-10]